MKTTEKTNTTSDVQKNNPTQQSSKNVLQVMGVQTFSGPLPSPDHLERYEKLSPGVTNRLLTITEEQVDHRIQIEKGVINNVIRQKWVKLISAIVAMFVILALGFILALKGITVLAGILLTTTLLGVLAIFVLGQSPTEKK